MEFRQLGYSGLRVPVLSFGAGTFGGRGEFFKAWGNTDVAEATRLVDICLEAGVNFFDTADVYSSGASEEILGKAAARRRGDVLISTKATFRMGNSPNDLGSSRYHLIRACEASLRRLNTDYIDVYHLHGFDAISPVEETLKTLDTLVESGKVRYIACSNFSGWHLMKSLAISEKYGWTRYVAHQVYYSLIGRDYEWELMPLALDQKVAAIVWSPLGWGRLTGKIRRGQPLPEVSRLHKTSQQGPQVADLGRNGARDWKDHSASSDKLAPTAPNRSQRNYRRSQRRTIAPKPGCRGVESHSRSGSASGCCQRRSRSISILAPAPIRRPKPSAGLGSSPTIPLLRRVPRPSSAWAGTFCRLKSVPSRHPRQFPLL
jgi:aryl-alcohol dehydrogenase-like predicted oxidoreductase